jgi:hypothetical protein
MTRSLRIDTNRRKQATAQAFNKGARPTPASVRVTSGKVRSTITTAESTCVTPLSTCVTPLHTIFFRPAVSFSALGSPFL